MAGKAEDFLDSAEGFLDAPEPAPTKADDFLESGRERDPAYLHYPKALGRGAMQTMGSIGAHIERKGVENLVGPAPVQTPSRDIQEAAADTDFASGENPFTVAMEGVSERTGKPVEQMVEESDISQTRAARKAWDDKLAKETPEAKQRRVAIGKSLAGYGRAFSDKAQEYADDYFPADQQTQRKPFDERLSDDTTRAVLTAIIENAPNTAMSLGAAKIMGKLGKTGAYTGAAGSSYVMESGDIFQTGVKFLEKEYGGFENVPDHEFGRLIEVSQAHGLFNAGLDALMPGNIASAAARRQLADRAIQKLMSAKSAKEIGGSAIKNAFLELAPELVQEDSAIVGESRIGIEHTPRDIANRKLQAAIAGGGIGGVTGAASAVSDIRARNAEVIKAGGEQPKAEDFLDNVEDVLSGEARAAKPAGPAYLPPPRMIVTPEGEAVPESKYTPRTTEGMGLEEVAGAKQGRAPIPAEPTAPPVRYLPPPRTVVTPEGVAATEAQLDAARRAQSQRAQELGTTEVEGAVQGRAPLPEIEPSAEASVAEPEDLIKVISRAGGLSRGEAKSQGIDPAVFTDQRSRQVFGRPLFPKQGGMTMDGLAEFLSQRGFLPEGQYSANEALDLVDRALRGEKIYSTYSAADAFEKQAAERDAELREQSRGQAGPVGLKYRADDLRSKITAVQRNRIKNILGDDAARLWEPKPDDFALSGYIKESPDVQDLTSSMYEGRRIMGDEAFEAFFERFSTQNAELDGDAFESKLTSAIRSHGNAQKPGDAEANRAGAGRVEETAQPRGGQERENLQASTPDQAGQEVAPAGADRSARQDRPETRRQDAEQRKSVSEMSPDELRRELLTDSLTGLPNRRAYDESTKKPVQVAIDLDSLKWINDEMGHESGDKALEALGQALRESGFEAYHISGDEFMAQDDDRAAIENGMTNIRSRLDNAVIHFEHPDGSTTTKTGVHFSYGIGATRNEADTALSIDKANREASGRRAARGEAPGGVERRAKAQPDNQDRPAANQEVTTTSGTKENAGKSEQLPRSAPDREQRSGSSSSSSGRNQPNAGGSTSNEQSGPKESKAVSQRPQEVTPPEQPPDSRTPRAGTETPSKEGVSLSEKPKAKPADLAGEVDTTKQAVHDQQVARQKKIDEAPPMEAGPGDLFSEKSKQAELFAPMVEAAKAMTKAAEDLTIAVKEIKNDKPTDQPEVGAGTRNELADADASRGNEVSFSPVDEAAHEAATSAQNDLPTPTEAQKDAGNYAKGHATIGGLDIAIENPAGSKRRPEWPDLKSHYGYFKRTEGKDGDQVDVFVKPGTPEDYSGTVFVIDQIKTGNGHFDELKVMLGFRDVLSAKMGYLANYTKGWKGLGAINGTTFDDFKDFIKNGDTKKPFADWIEKNSGATRKTIPSRVPVMATYEGSLSQSERQEVPNVRGEGNSRLQKMAAELPGVSRRRGQAPASETDAGAEGQQQGVPSGQRGVGDTDRAGSESTKQRLDRVSRETAVDSGLVEGDRDTARNTEKQDGGVSMERGESADDSSRSTKKEQQNADAQRTDEADGAVVERTGNQLRDTEKQVGRSQVAGRKGVTGESAVKAALSIGEENPNGDVAELRSQVLADHDGADIDDVTEAVHEGQYQGIRKIGEAMPVKVLESDISKDLANRAFNGTSHTPERRAKVAIRDYVRTMVAAWKNSEEHAKTPQDRLRLTEQFRVFKDGYVTRMNSYLSAHGRVMSAFIVGPAKFPTSSNAKKSNSADNRMAELTEWERKGIKRLTEAAKGPTDKTTAGELDVARRKLQERQKLQEAMKAANKVVRDKNLSNDQKVAKIIESGLSEKLAREALKPDFMDRTGFPDYAMKNNNAEIRRLTQRVAELQGKQQKAEEVGGSQEVSFDGGTVELDYANGVLRIRHNAKPPVEVRDQLKREGFHWSPTNTAWQRKITDNSIVAAERITGAELKAKESDSDAPQFSRASDQTNTPEFLKWFGDSKVVDANGKPLVVYHGTDKSFTKFNPKKATMGGIHWFTSDKSAVEAGEVGAQGKGKIYELYASLKNPAGWNEYNRYGLGQLKSLGYDGAILPESDGTFTGFFFEPTQVKSATKNRGTFDPNDPNILFSRESTVDPTKGTGSGISLPNGIDENIKDKVAALEEAGQSSGTFRITAGKLLDAVLDGNLSKEAREELQPVKVLQDLFGAPVALVSSEGKFQFNGVYHQGMIWISVGANKSLPIVFGHELSHRMEADNPAAYNALLNAVRPLLRDQERYEVLKSMEELSDNFVQKEMLGDLLGDSFADPSFWQQVAANTSRTDFNKIITAIRMWIDRVIAKLRGLGSEKFVSDLEAARKIMAKAVANYADTRKAGEKQDGAKFSRKTAETTEPTTVKDVAPGLLSAYRTRARKVIDRIDRALDPMGNLPDSKAYLTKRYLVLGRIAKGDEIAKVLGRAFRNASAADKQAVYDYLTTKDASPKSIQNEIARADAVRAKGLIESVSDAMVSRGMLSEAAREAHRGSYLPQLYLKWLLNDADVKSLGAGKKPSDMGYLKGRKIERTKGPDGEARFVWRDSGTPLSDAQVLDLGPISDPGFLAATAIAKPVRDMALLDFLSAISQNEKWILPNTLVDFEGAHSTPQFLKAEAERLRRQADHYSPEDAKTTRALADRMDTVANKALGSLSGDFKNYREVPNTAKYGRLRGLWVRKEIYDDLVGAYDMSPEDPGFVQSLLGYGGIGTKITQLWKMSKVSLNPPAQVRNFVSNGVLMQLSGVPLHKVPVYLAKAIRAITNNGPHWKVAKKYGVTESTFSTQELFRIKRDLLDLEMREGRLKPLGKLHRMGAIIADGASDAYQFSEALYKTAKIMHAMDNGATEADAAIEAMRWLFDYSLVPKSVRYARNAPIGVPFLCVSDDTEAMTSEGWKGIDEIKDGDLVASFDMESEKISWKPVLGVYRSPYDGDMVHVKNKSLDILMTPDHRCVTYRRKKSGQSLGIVSAKDLNSRDSIPCSAPFEHKPVGDRLSDNVVRLCGWIVAEGTFHPSGGIIIGQNEGDKECEIRGLLNQVVPDGFSERSIRFENGNALHYRFHIKSAGAKMFRELLPDKHLTPSLLMRLSTEQIKLLVQAILDGDGHVMKNGTTVLIQNPGPTSDAFQIALTMIGRASVARRKPPQRSLTITMKRSGRAHLCNTTTKETEHYNGRIWCPEVPGFTTWVARRNGKVFITGNTFQYKVLPRLAEVALLHPQRLIPWITLFAGWPLLWSTLADEDEDEYERLQKALPQWLQERGHAMILPYTDEEGRSQVLDLGYFMPWSMYTDALGDMARGEIGETAQTLGIFSGPLTNVIVAMKTGKDPFTGRDIMNQGDPAGRQFAAAANYTWDMMMPPIVSSRGLISPMGLVDAEYGGKLVSATTGRTNKLGEPTTTATQAALYPFGLNVYSIEPQHSTAQNVLRLKYEADQTEQAVKRKLQNRALSDEARREIVEEYTEELKRRYQKIEEYKN